MLPKTNWVQMSQDSRIQVHTELVYSNGSEQVGTCHPISYVHSEINPQDSKGNYSATSNNTKLVHWPLMGGLLHLVQRGGACTGCGLLAVPKVTAHPSTASVPMTVLLYDGPLLCGFNVAIKGLRCTEVPR